MRLGRREFRQFLNENLVELANKGIAKCVASNLKWGEGPAYFELAKGWVFSDIPNNRMLSWNRQVGLQTFRDPSQFSNGNTIASDGSLLTCEHGLRRVTRTDLSGRYEVLCDAFEGKRLNSPNDIIEHDDGSIWFSDPTYGILSDSEGYRALAEQTANRVYRLDPATRELEAQIDQLKMPNGLCFSPDFHFLYVADSAADMGPEVPFDEAGPRNVYMFRLDERGRVTGQGHLLVRVPKGVPDGVRCDEEGYLWIATGEGIQCVSPDGRNSALLRSPETVSNLSFGSVDGTELFITLATSAYVVSLVDVDDRGKK